MSEPVIHLRSAVSLIGRFPALSGVDLDIESGSVVVLAGPNGAGKTTLLRLCAGLAPLQSGVGMVLGLDVATVPGRRQVRRRVGLLGHSTALYDDLTVEQNVRFWTAANRSDSAGVAPVLQRLGLDGRLGSVPVSGLSAGQRRRTALAIMVCRRSPLWLMDEPHAGLDPAGRDLIDELVRGAADAGATVVLASHDLERAEQLADRVVTVVGGQVGGVADVG